MSKKPWKSKTSIDMSNFITNKVFFDNELLLVAAVIQQACKEYRQAYKTNNRTKCQALEKWFYGPQFELWTLGNISPDSLLRGIRNQIDEQRDHKYSHPRVRK